MTLEPAGRNRIFAFRWARRRGKCYLCQLIQPVVARRPASRSLRAHPSPTRRVGSYGRRSGKLAVLRSPSTGKGPPPRKFVFREATRGPLCATLFSLFPCLPFSRVARFLRVSFGPLSSYPLPTIFLVSLVVDFVAGVAVAVFQSARSNRL